MTGRHSLNATRKWDDWVNEHGEPRPPLIRPPRWLIQAWARIDHARYVARYGHTDPRRSDRALAVYYHTIRPKP
jgi:hypothetical protein